MPGGRKKTARPSEGRLCFARGVRDPTQLLPASQPPGLPWLVTLSAFGAELHRDESQGEL